MNIKLGVSYGQFKSEASRQAALESAFLNIFPPYE